MAKQLFDFLTSAESLVRQGAWQRLADLGVGSALQPGSISSSDLTNYEAALQSSIEDAARRVKKKTKALYWEFDPDNDWASSIMLTASFDLLGTDWAADEHDHVPGPAMEAFAELYRSNSRSENILVPLAAQTLASFGRAYERVGFFNIPMGAAFHDADTILVMPRPGVDLDELYRKAEARLFKLPAGEWLVMGDRGRGGGSSITGHAFPQDRTWRGRDFRRAFPEPAPIEGWMPQRLEIRNGAATGLLADVRGAAVFSEALRSVIEESREPDDAIEWLPATAIDGTGREHVYWYLHFISKAPPRRRVILKGKRGDYETKALDHDACAGRRILPYQMDMKDLGFFVVHRSLAERIVGLRLRDLGWRQYATTKDRNVQEILDQGS